MQRGDNLKAAKRVRDDTLGDRETQLETDIAVLTAVVASHIPGISTPFDRVSFAEEFSRGVVSLGRDRVGKLHESELKRKDAERKRKEVDQQLARMRQDTTRMQKEIECLREELRVKQESENKETLQAMAEQMRIHVEARVMDKHVRDIVAHSNAAMKACGVSDAELLSVDAWLLRTQLP